MDKSEETLMNGRGNDTTKGRLGSCRLKVFAVKDESGSFTFNMKEVIRVVQKFYSELLRDQDGQVDRNEEENRRI